MPIVPVLKSDGQSVRICGDFRLTVNQASKLDRYPIPKIEDLFASLSGRKAFAYGTPNVTKIAFLLHAIAERIHDPPTVIY